MINDGGKPMLKLNVNEEKQLTFEVQIGGVQSDQVKSHLKIEIDSVEYGFPAEVGKESITVNLPPLRTVTARRLKEGEEVEVKLEIIADGNYVTPWRDTFRLSNPLVIEAKIIDDDFTSSSFKTKLVTEWNKGEQTQGVKIEKITEEDSQRSNNEDILTEKIVNKLAEKLSNQKLNEEKPPVPDEDEGDEEVDESCGKPHNESITTEDILNISEEQIYAYMERAGTKNTQVQKIIYEQGEKEANSSRPVDVLKQVVKILKTKK